MCMTIGCNLQMKYCHIVLQFELHQFPPKHIGSGYHVNATPPTKVSGPLLNIAAVFEAEDVHVIRCNMGD